MEDVSACLKAAYAATRLALTSNSKCDIYDHLMVSYVLILVTITKDTPVGLPAPIRKLGSYSRFNRARDFRRAMKIPVDRVLFKVDSNGSDFLNDIVDRYIP